MNSTFNNQAVAAGFNALAQALSPNYSQMIEADLAARKGLNIDADTRYRDALTGQTGAATAQTQAQTSRINADNAAIAQARQALQGGVMDPNTIAAILSGGMGDAQVMNAMPGYVQTARTHLDPAYGASDAASSNAALTGVAPMANTPTGHANAVMADVLMGREKNQTALDQERITQAGATERQNIVTENDAAVEANKLLTEVLLGREGNVNNLDVQRLQNEGQMDQLRFKADHPTAANTKPLNFGAMDTGRTDEAVAAAIAETYGVEPDQAMIGAVQARAAEIYRTSGNWPAAVQEALASFEKKETGGGWFDGPHTVTLIPKSAGTPAVSAPAKDVAPASGGGQPDAAAGESEPQYKEGQILQNANGVRIMLKNNDWVLVQ